MQKRTWILAGVLTLALAGGAVVVQAAPWGAGTGTPGQGYGMMGGGGQGMMGGGGQGMMGRGMMGPGARGEMPCLGEDGTFDPAAALAQAEAMLAQHKAYGDSLKARLEQATDEQVKAALAVRMERQILMTDRVEAHIAVLKTLTTETEPLQGALAVARGDVDYWTRATATDTGNKAVIAAHLARAQRRVEALKAQLAAKSSN